MFSLRQISLSGQSVAEYALGAALIGVVSIGALTFFATGVSDAFPDWIKAIFGGPSQLVASGPSPTSPTATETPASEPLPPTEPPTEVAAMDVPSPGVDTSGRTTVALTLPSGLKLSIPNLPSDLVESVETSGANGTTAFLSAFLQELAQELKDAGEIDQAQLNLLKDLANQGYRMAGIEAILEQSINNANGDRQAYLATQVSFDGQTMSAYELGRLVGVASSYTSQTLGSPLNSKNGDPFPETLAFINLYNRAQASGALSNPAVQTIVEKLSSEIVVMSDILEDQNWKLGGATEPVTAQQLEDVKVSTMTSLNSTSICSAGGSQTSGIQCQ